MQVKVVTMRYDESVHGFADEEIRKACEGCELLDVTEHFFVHGNVPHLALVLKVTVGSGARRQQCGGQTGSGSEDLELFLPEAHRPAYRELKKWRNEKAKADGKPAYTVARNTQLFEIVKAMPLSCEALKAIEGIGEAFVKNYAKDVLAILEKAPKIEPGVESRNEAETAKK